MRHSLSAVVATMMTLLASGPEARAGAVRGGIQYGPDPAQLLDLYRADGSAAGRLVVFVHGGWRGHRGEGATLAGPLNAAGFTVADVDYRPLPPSSVPGAASDVATAAAFLVAHARDYGLAPERFAFAGYSAGSNIAGLAATDPSYLRQAGIDPSRLAALLVLDGVFDVTVNMQSSPSRIFYRVWGTDPDRWRALSPSVQVTTLRTKPRFCLAGEDKDPRMVEQRQLFERALRASGQTLETVVAPRIGHGQMIRLFADPTEPLASFATACLRRGFEA